MLQGQTDTQLARSDDRRVCPVTGLSLTASWQAEQRLLRPLPVLSEPFNMTARRPVQRDCTVSFEGRTSSVPCRLCGRVIEVRGGAEVVQVWYDGRIWAEHPRHTQRRVVLDLAHNDALGDERVPPVPLGQMG